MTSPSPLKTILHLVLEQCLRWPWVSTLPLTLFLSPRPGYGHRRVRSRVSKDWTLLLPDWQENNSGYWGLRAEGLSTLSAGHIVATCSLKSPARRLVGLLCLSLWCPVLGFPVALPSLSCEPLSFFPCASSKQAPLAILATTPR